MAWGVPKIGTSVIDATGNFDLIEPAGVAQGDLMVAFIAMRGNAVVSLSGWTAAATQQSSGDTDTTDGIASGAMFYVVRGSSAPNLTVTRTGGDVAYAKVISYSGVSLTSPYDTGSSATQGSAGNTPTTTGFNTANAGELIVAMVAYGDQYTVSAFDAATDPTTASGATDTTTAPTNGTWIERFDANTNTGADTGIGIADAVRATAGATGNIQATVSSALGRNVIMAAAFKLEESPTTVLNSPADASTDSDTTPTLDFTGTDNNGDSIEYNVQIDTVNTFEGQSFAVTSATGGEITIRGATGSNEAAAQSFLANSGLLTFATFRIRKQGTPADNLFAEISSTLGGSVLATSANISGASLTGSLANTVIDFSSSGFSFVGGNTYFISFKRSGARDITNYFAVGTGGDNGYSDGSLWASSSGTWSQVGGGAFDADGTFSLAPLLNKVSSTDQGFADIHTFYDNFDDNSEDTAKWTSFATGTATISETGGKVVATPPNTTAGANYSGYVGDVTFNLTGKGAIVQVPQVTNTATNAQSYFAVIKDSSNRLEILVEGTSIFFRKIVAGTPTSVASATYNASTHLWWRIREAGGTTFWDTSTDGITWTNRASQANPITITTVWTEFGAGTYQSETSPGSAQFDNVSVGSTNPYTSGNKVGYTVQGADALADDTYYWRVRGKDPAGSNTYGAWSDTRSFTVSSGGAPSPNSNFLAFM